MCTTLPHFCWGREVEPSTKFSKRGGLTGPQLLEGGCWERRGWLFWRRVKNHWKITDFSLKNPTFRDKGSRKTNIEGWIAYKTGGGRGGLGQFADLREVWQERGEWCFWVVHWYPNPHYEVPFLLTTYPQKINVTTRKLTLIPISSIVFVAE